MAKRKSDFKIGKAKLTNHTSITESEFDYVLPFFENAFDNYFKHFTLLGNERIRAVSKRNDSVFKKPEDGLFFILFYLKSYPTEEVQATIFDMYQSQVSVWKKLLQKILEDSFL